MKRMVLLVLLVLWLPVAAYGNSIDVMNSGGTLTGLTSGLSLSGSTLLSVITLADVHNYTLNGSAQVSSGGTNVVVPESGTLSLFGIGLAGLSGLIRRRMRTR